MKRIGSLIVFVVAIIFITSCSGNQPSKSELKSALTNQLPTFTALKSFTVNASQNFGNKVDPVYGSRFEAEVNILTDLYRRDSEELTITFVSLSANKGSNTKIFGKITSELFQGAWQHNVDIDGNPINKLGTPLNQIQGVRIIVRGSDKEKQFFSETKRLLSNCGQFTCVYIRAMENGRCRGDCARNVQLMLQRLGVSANVNYWSEDFGSPGCIGIREDLGGTSDGAELLKSIMGSKYTIGECRIDGFRYNLKLE